MLEHAFELRYQVYCLERGFLSPSHYPDGRESDEHDTESAHFGAYADGGDLVGYVRLVQPQDGRFPFQQHCTALLHDVSLPQSGTAAEISRLMVRKEYRRGGPRDSLRRVDAADVAPAADAQRASESTGVLLELYRAMYISSLESGIRYWYAAMERPLARSLRRWNFAFTQITAETDYFGPVALYMADLRDLETRLTATNPGLLAWLRSPQAANDWRVQHLPLWTARRDKGLHPSHRGQATQPRPAAEHALSFPATHGRTSRHVEAKLALAA
jgi:N-acyl amino acid synthase of PEP-CTERM/exosortase system